MARRRRRRGTAAVGTAAALLACAIGGASAAHAQAPTTSFSTTYRAFNAWDGWRGANADLCTQTQPIRGSEPAAPGRYPVVVYLHGTLADWGGNLEGRRFAAAAAAQGFVAAAVSYDSWVVNDDRGIDGNARCVFRDTPAGGALARICARPKADCSRGVAVAGFSAGGAIAGRAANVAQQIRAAWLMGVSGPATPTAIAAPDGTRALPDDRLRITVGRTDLDGRDLSALNRMTGQDCAAPACLRADGSGFYVVSDQEVADGVADHCWWMSVNRWVPTNSCTWTPEFDPGFMPSSEAPWSLGAGLAWLRSKLGP